MGVPPDSGKVSSFMLVRLPDIPERIFKPRINWNIFFAIENWESSSNTKFWQVSNHFSQFGLLRDLGMRVIVVMRDVWVDHTLETICIRQDPTSLPTCPTNKWAFSKKSTVNLGLFICKISEAWSETVSISPTVQQISRWWGSLLIVTWNRGNSSTCLTLLSGSMYTETAVTAMSGIQVTAWFFDLTKTCRTLCCLRSLCTEEQYRHCVTSRAK
jgi:hypothetical protein